MYVKVQNVKERKTYKKYHVKLTGTCFIIIFKYLNSNNIASLKRNYKILS